MFSTALITFAILSVGASALTTAALMLSSRISQSECLIEVYDVEDSAPLLPSSYYLER